MFLILIAVALFAALSYAVTQSTSVSDKGANKESDNLAAAQILQYATHMQQTILRLMLTSGCSDTQLNFNNTVDTNYVNPLAPSDGRCNVFGSGGGLVFQLPPTATGTTERYVISAFNRISNIGTSEREMVIYLPIKSESLCRQINAALDLPVALALDYIGDPAQLSAIKFKGVYGSAGGGNLIPDDGGNISGYRGAKTACFQSVATTSMYPRSADVGYFLMSVLLER